MTGSRGWAQRGVLLVCAVGLALASAWTAAFATEMPNVRVRFHPATREVKPGRAIPIEIEIVSKEDVGEAIFQLKPGAAWRFDRGDRQWRGHLGVGSRVSLHAVLTPTQAKVDRVYAELKMPQRGATRRTFLDLQPDIPVRGLCRPVPPGTAVVPSPPPPPGAAANPGISVGLVASAPSATSTGTDSGHVRAASPGCTVTVSGRFVYQDDKAAWHAMRYALVRVWDYDCNSADDLIAEGYADANGYFSLSGYFEEGGGECSDDAADVYVAVSLDNGAILVKPEDSDDSYTGITPTYWDVCGNLDVGTWGLPPGDDAGCHIMNTLHDAWEFITAYVEPDPTGIVVRWPSAEWPHYDGEDIHMLGPDFDWNEGTYCHEYGHFIAHQYLERPGHDYCNGICDVEECRHCAWAPENPPIAYVEGWAEYFSQAVTVLYNHDDKSFTVPTEPETPYHPHGHEDFENIEGYWAAVFWDIHDANNDDHEGDGIFDSLSCGFGCIWYVMRNYHPGGPGTVPKSLREFYDGWCLLYPSQKQQLWNTMAENHIFMPDPSEPDGTCPAPVSRTLPADGTTQWHMLDSWDDRDWFRVVLMGPATPYEIKTLPPGAGYCACTDTALELYASDCTTLVAQNDDYGGKCSRISFAQDSSSSGNSYFLKVRPHYADDVGPYGVRVSVICPQDQYEPNGACPPAIAAAVQVNGPPSSRVICPAGDQDWVRFQAVLGMTYVVETLHFTNVACADTVVRLYGTNCSTVIAENDDFGGTACSRVTWTAYYSGWVYVQIRGHADSYIGPYRLSVTCQGDSFEPDDTYADAAFIGSGGTVQERNLCAGGDEDWVGLNVLCGMTYTIQTTMLILPPCTDTVLELYDSDGTTLLASNDNIGQNACSRIVWTADWSKTVYIRVHGALPSTTGTYGVMVTAQQDAYEPDDSCAQARSILTTGIIQAHSAWPAFEQDWVTFSVTTGWEYHISTLPWPNTCPCTDTKLYLYAADCTTLLASNDDYAGTPCSRIDWVSDRTAAVYVKIIAHTVVHPFPGPYGLQVRKTSPYPIAAFIWTPLNPTCADTVQFRDNSTNGVGHTIVSWLWTFGDGQTSTEVNPTHRYADNGEYRVCLRVTDDAAQTSTGCNTITVANPCPSAIFEFVPAAPAPLQEVQFSNTSQDPCGSITSCSWDFGDGATLTDCAGTVTHAYQSPGFYTVCLTVTDDDGCQDFTCQVIGVYCHPTAAFTWSPGSPTCADTIQFTDQSIIGEGCSIAKWLWAFGDGQTSTDQNPTHQYEEDGVYEVCHMAMDTEGSEHTTCQTITVANACPTAAFEFGPASPEGPGLVAGAGVVFQNNYTHPCGSIASYFWDFDDGSTSVDCSPWHVFDSAGTYNVCMTVTDDDGCADTVCHDVTIGPACNPIASFAWMPQKFTCADTVNFSGRCTDMVGCTIVSWAWDFGDGQTSADQNPTHRFAPDGIYTVCLTVTDSANLTNTVCKTVQVGPACPVASFQHEPAQGCALEGVVFTDTSTDPCGGITAWSWDFGDSSTSTDQNPIHTYQSPDIYTVSLTITSLCGSHSKQDQIIVCADRLVGDAYPTRRDRTGDGDSDDCLEFGDDLIDWMDVISVYYCFIGVECPQPDSARFDAMDSYPMDQVDASCAVEVRGGDYEIDWMDVIVTYYRFVEDPPCKPRRRCGSP